MADQAELPLNRDPFQDPAVKMALQAAIMDGIVVDTHPTLTIRVPEALVDQIADILSPFMACNAENAGG